jgi:hypothetical protein
MQPLPAPTSDGLPNLGTLPLGPDEPTLFTDALRRILRHLDDDGAGRQATWIDRFARPNQ